MPIGNCLGSVRVPGAGEVAKQHGVAAFGHDLVTGMNGALAQASHILVGAHLHELPGLALLWAW